jgi:hypothetical protein
MTPGGNMVLSVKVTTPQASGEFEVIDVDIPHAFHTIPIRAARLGFGLLNDGTPVTYEVRVTDAG